MLGSLGSWGTNDYCDAFRIYLLRSTHDKDGWIQI